MADPLVISRRRDESIQIGDDVSITVVEIRGDLVRLAVDSPWKVKGGEPSITCPRCGMTSYHPEDIRNRYCGNCHRFEGDP